MFNMLDNIFNINIFLNRLNTNYHFLQQSALLCTVSQNVLLCKQESMYVSK
jgi:hypothetical protein